MRGQNLERIWAKKWRLEWRSQARKAHRAGRGASMPRVRLTPEAIEHVQSRERMIFHILRSRGIDYQVPSSTGQASKFMAAQRATWMANASTAGIPVDWRRKFI